MEIELLFSRRSPRDKSEDFNYAQTKLGEENGEKAKQRCHLIPRLLVIAYYQVSLQNPPM